MSKISLSPENNLTNRQHCGLIEIIHKSELSNGAEEKPAENR
jgi:hypothetical protein